MSLRKKSKNVPCRLLVPLFIVMVTCAPPPKPYSAEYALVWILNSSSASIEGTKLVVWTRGSLAGNRKSAGAVVLIGTNSELHARHQQCQALHVASVERQFHDAAVLDDST